MRSSAVPVLVAFVSLTAACASDDVIDNVYDPCSPLTLAVADDIGAPELHGVETAIAAWRDVIPARITIGSGARASDVLPVRFEPGDTLYRAIYWDSVGAISISRDRLAPEDYGIALAHELGHAFGLHHVAPSARPSVMNIGNLEQAPTGDDAAAVERLWQSCSDAQR